MLKAGFARLDVTPPLGSDLSGYFHRRAAMRELAPEKFLVCAVCANGYEGYFPTEEAFGQGGYEAKSSLFTPTLEREVVDAAKSIFHRHK